MEEETAYSLLQVPQHARSHEVLAAYCKLALKFHPRRYEPHESFIRIHFQKLAEAYTILMDPEQRRRYDMLLREFAVNRGQQFGRNPTSPARPRRSSFSGIGGSTGLNRSRLPVLGTSTEVDAEEVFRRVVRYAISSQRPSQESSRGTHSVQDQGEQVRRGSVVLSSIHNLDRVAGVGSSIARPSTAWPQGPPAQNLPQPPWAHPPPIRSGSCAPHMPVASSSTSQSVTSVRDGWTVGQSGSYHAERVTISRVVGHDGALRELVRRQSTGMTREPVNRRSFISETSSRPGMPERQGTSFVEYQPLSSSRTNLDSSHRIRSIYDGPEDYDRGTAPRAGPSYMNRGSSSKANSHVPSRSQGIVRQRRQSGRF